MKKIVYSVMCLLLLAGCSDFFESDMSSVANIDGREVRTERQAFYQMNGLMQLMQKAAGNYVVLGELRGDLVTQTDNSSQDLRDVETFSMAANNVFGNSKTLYALVNNCNYFIDCIDKDALGEKADTIIAQTKCIRAWAYHQLVLDYGKAYYFTKPITNVDDKQIEDSAEVVDNVRLTQLLIADLLPYCPSDGVRERLPFASAEYASVNSYPLQYMFIPIRWMLAELYMWQEDFQNAARMYYQLMLDRELVAGNYQNKWRNALCEDVNVRNWQNQFTTLSSKYTVTLIPLPTDFAADMTDVSYLFGDAYQMAASKECQTTFNSYPYNIMLNTVPVSGDLRGEGIMSDYGSYTLQEPVGAATGVKTEAHITKYGKLNFSGSNYISLCRSPFVYLRYAEAVNRLGMHKLAMAVLKYGLTPTTLSNSNYVDTKNMAAYPDFTDFGQTTLTLQGVFRDNAPLHKRGCGDCDVSQSYVIDTSTGADSLTVVEDKIMDEYVLECAFEGNRFHDLMRISQYRGTTAYLAERVASKLAAVKGTTRTKEEWKTFLSNKENWYVK